MTTNSRVSPNDTTPDFCNAVDGVEYAFHEHSLGTYDILNGRRADGGPRCIAKVRPQGFDPSKLHHYVDDVDWFAERCPVCHLPAAFLIDVRKEHWAVCPTDRVRWWAGFNVATTYWRMDDDVLLDLFGTTDRDILESESVRQLERLTDREVDPHAPDGSKAKGDYATWPWAHPDDLAPKLRIVQ